MATGGGKRGPAQRGKTAPAQRGKAGPAKRGKTVPAKRGKTEPAKRDARATPPSPPPAAQFRLGAIPGATPGTWIGRWNERMPQTPLELVPLDVATQREALRSGAVDAALVRLPLERDGLHVISLYDEVPVVVMAVESVLSTVDELTAADLAGEVLITPSDDVLGGIGIAGAVAPSFTAPVDTAEAIETVAAGVGVVIVPMSLARLHHRRDVTFRPLREGPLSTVALAWPVDRTTPEVESFVGIVRGRTANSSR